MKYMFISAVLAVFMCGIGSSHGSNKWCRAISSAPDAAGTHGSALGAPGVKVNAHVGRVSVATRCLAAHYSGMHEPYVTVSSRAQVHGGLTAASMACANAEVIWYSTAEAPAETQFCNLCCQLYQAVEATRQHHTLGWLAAAAAAAAATAFQEISACTAADGLLQQL
jgi:hypothetical protein